MATTKGKAAFSFLLDHLRANKKATFAECKAACAKRHHQVWPIMFGRAKALLGLVKVAARGTGRYAKAKGAPAKRAAVSKAREDGAGLRTDIVSSVRALGDERARLLEALLKVQKIVFVAIGD